MSDTRHLGCLFLVATVCAPQTAHADGGYFPDNVTPGSTAETTDQRAVLFYEQGYTTLILQTGYQGNGADFGWIIPTASPLVDAAAVDPSRPETQPFQFLDYPVFDAMHMLTAPMLVTFDQGCGAYGCAGADGSGTGGSGEVRIFDSFVVDDHEVAVVQADAAQDLVDWLTTNNYRVPANATTVFEDYVSRSFYFVAVKYAGAVEDPRPVGGDAGSTGDPASNAARPFALRFPGAMRIFPLLISSMSTKQTVDIVLYTIDTRRYTVLNFPTVDMVIKDAFEGQDFTAWYNERLDGVIAANGGNAFVVEFAASVDGAQISQALGRPHDAAADDTWFVTRFRTRIAPEAMTQDVQLAPLQGEDASKLLRIRVMRGAEPGRVTAMLPLDLTLILALGLVLQWRRRRSRGAR